MDLQLSIIFFPKYNPLQKAQHSGPFLVYGGNVLVKKIPFLYTSVVL